jgi:hypothetical protein
MIFNRCICGFMPNLHKKILNGIFCRCASETPRRTRNSRSFILEYILGSHNFNISKMLFDSFTFGPQESLSNKLYNLVCNFALQSRSNFGSSKGWVFSEDIFNLVIYFIFFEDGTKSKIPSQITLPLTKKGQV